MGAIRKRIKSESGFGAVALALMNDGKPYDVPSPKKGEGSLTSKPSQGKGVFMQDIAIPSIETVIKVTASKPLLVVTKQMQTGDVGAFERFSQVL